MEPLKIAVIVNALASIASSFNSHVAEIRLRFLCSVARTLVMLGIINIVLSVVVILMLLLKR